MMWHVVADRADAQPGRGYLATDLHPQDGQRLILTGVPALSYVFETRESAEAFAALANLPGIEVLQGTPEGELSCPPMLIVHPAGN